MQLASVDANLLVVLDALLDTQSVSAASKRLGLSPSATSHALARLRGLFADDLLVRAGHKMVPTALAEALQPRLRTILADMEALFVGSAAVDAARLERSFRVLTSDYVETLLLVALSARLAVSAREVRIHSRHVPPDKAELLRAGHADLVIARWLTAPADMERRLLFEDRLVMVVRRGHPVLTAHDGGPLGLARYIELGHVLIAPQGGERGIVDDHLATLGRERRVTRVVSTFMTAPALVASSDLAVTMSARLALRLARDLDVVLLEPPAELELAPYAIHMYWHRRADDDPAHRWLRDHIVEVAGELAPIDELASLGQA